MALGPRRPITCRGCGSSFARMPVQPRRQYCTWDCFKRSRHVTLVCSVCAAPFDSYKSEERKRQDRGHAACCSRACRNIFTSRLLGGDGTWVEGGRYDKPNQRPGWAKTRRMYMRSVGGACEGCGASAIEVHHLRPLARGGELLDFDNLMAVCGVCHKGMHAALRAGLFDDCFEACNA